mgnify:CR=1 FL=1
MPEQDQALAETQEQEQIELILPEQEESEQVDFSENSDLSSEQEEYGDGVKKRINKLTYKLREAERQEAEALAFAKKVREENNTLQRRLKTSDNAMFSEYDNRVNSQLEVAKEQYRKAYESGDADEMIKANEQLSRLAVESESLKRVSNQKKAAEAAEQQSVQPEAARVPAQQEPSSPPPPPDPKAQDWASRNEWFGQDKVKTYAAFGIHEELAEEGYDGKSDEYYQELDKRLYNTFSQQLNTQIDERPVQTVASPTRQSKPRNARNKVVKLSQSQVAIANKLGVPLEEYAKYVRE